MRVIAGRFKGRKLASVKDELFRPTLDRVKESVFNVLGNDIIDSNILDLFCGSGSLGIESLSRGAMRAVFVDSNKKILNTAQKNVDTLNAGHKAKFVLADAFEFLENHKNLGVDIIFADPPYDKEYGGRICKLITEHSVLKKGGIFVLERFKKDNPEPETLKLLKRLKFGQTEIDFYIREE